MSVECKRDECTNLVGKGQHVFFGLCILDTHQEQPIDGTACSSNQNQKGVQQNERNQKRKPSTHKHSQTQTHKQTQAHKQTKTHKHNQTLLYPSHNAQIASQQTYPCCFSRASASARFSVPCSQGSIDHLLCSKERVCVFLFQRLFVWGRRNKGGLGQERTNNNNNNNTQKEQQRKTSHCFAVRAEMTIWRHLAPLMIFRGNSALLSPPLSCIHSLQTRKAASKTTCQHTHSPHLLALFPAKTPAPRSPFVFRF